MTTDRQVSANRENAQKSTGPTSARGKAASSMNARRHGLTGALDEEAIVAWYRIILEDASAVLNPFEQDPYFRAAADLARAEAHLQRVRIAEEDWMRQPALPPFRAEEDLQDLQDHVLEALVEEAWFQKRLKVEPEGRLMLCPWTHPTNDEEYLKWLEDHSRDPLVQVGWNRKGFRLLRRLDRSIERMGATKEVEQGKRGRTLARYRASAEARRRIALRRWTEQITKRSQSQEADAWTP